MQTVTGHPLYDADGKKLGKVVDVLGLSSGTEDIGWLAVKLGLRGVKLVPNTGVEPHEDGFSAPFTKDEITSAPKVPPHFEPAGDDRDALLSHYGVRLAGL
jgi:hypothetical protein